MTGHIYGALFVSAVCSLFISNLISISYAMNEHNPYYGQQEPHGYNNQNNQHNNGGSDTDDDDDYDEMAMYEHVPLTYEQRQMLRDGLRNERERYEQEAQRIMAQDAMDRNPTYPIAPGFTWTASGLTDQEITYFQRNGRFMDNNLQLQYNQYQLNQFKTHLQSHLANLLPLMSAQEENWFVQNARFSNDRLQSQYNEFKSTQTW